MHGSSCNKISFESSFSLSVFFFLKEQFQQPWVPPTARPHAFPLCAGVKRGLLPKLDSRFVSDVTIMDGTIMAPSTHFTKIWRMRNNGNFVWALGTRLVWIGGDNFSKNGFIEIEVIFVHYITAL